jgi:chemotaxis protein methyltransferase CheR
MNLVSFNNRTGKNTDNPEFIQLKQKVIADTGLHYYLGKDQELADKIQERMRLLQIKEFAQYLQVLNNQVNEYELLISELTIGETYFFREKSIFSALETKVLPQIIQANSHSRKIRIWSAGCATGEELYSISILMQNRFSEELKGWDVTLLGTDINRKFLNSANEGKYRRWSFREVDESLVEDCFERDGEYFILKPRYRTGICFQYHNLVSNPFPSILDNLGNFDLVMCRNVMIYFDKSVLQKIIQGFQRSLKEGGYLVVGHAEHMGAMFKEFQILKTDAGIIYQKKDLSGFFETQKMNISPAIIKDKNPDYLQSLKNSKFLDKLGPIKTSAIKNNSDISANPESAKHIIELKSFEKLQALLHEGDWTGAYAEAQSLEGSHKLNVLWQFYNAIICDSLGFSQRAEEHLRKTIYLDRKFILGHYHLALFYYRNKDMMKSKKSFLNVNDLLSQMAADEKVPYSEGITVQQLRELAGFHLEVLENK